MMSTPSGDSRAPPLRSGARLIHTPVTDICPYTSGLISKIQPSFMIRFAYLTHLMRQKAPQKMTKNGQKCKKVLFSDSSEQTDTETCTYEKWSFS